MIRTFRGADGRRIRKRRRTQEEIVDRINFWTVTVLMMTTLTVIMTWAAGIRLGSGA